MKLTLLASVVVSVSIASSSHLGAVESFDRQVLDVIRENPSIVVEALAIIKAQREQAEKLAERERIAQHMDEILDLNQATYVKNPQGEKTIVEFYDYNCGFCKSAEPIMREIGNEHKNVRLIYREYPIFGEGSQYAALVSQALADQGLFEEFHASAMAASNLDSKEIIDAVAKDVGADMKLLEQQVQKEAYQDRLARVSELAKGIQLAGTPVFIIDGELHFGLLEKVKILKILDIVE